jgi:hypothetical protein
MASEKVATHQLDDLTPFADHDLGIEGKPAGEFDTQLCAADRLPDHKGTCGADVDRVEMLQLCGQPGGPEGSVTADVHTSQKNHESHSSPPNPGSASRLLL